MGTFTSEDLNDIDYCDQLVRLVEEILLNPQNITTICPGIDERSSEVVSSVLELIPDTCDCRTCVDFSKLELFLAHPKSDPLKTEARQRVAKL